MTEVANSICARPRICALVSCALLSFAAVGSDVAIPISEFEVAGIPFAADGEKVRSVLGKPKPQPPCEGCFDIVDYSYEYEGIVITMHQDEAWSFRVQSPAYRLKNGIGVGDRIDDVLKAFGYSGIAKREGKELLTYQAKWPARKIARVYLDLVIVDDHVESYVVTIR